MSSKKPTKKEEWDEFHAKNRALTKALKDRGKTYIDLDDIEFKNSLSELSQEALIAMKASMRSSMNFYKKILVEPYYTEHPEKKKTSRYEEAMRKAKSINSKGKIIHNLIIHNQ